MGMKFDDRVLVVLATSPAGLGHLRVMEALKQGLSSKTRLEIMGVYDPSIQWIHRLTSRNKSLKNTMEFIQHNRLAEKTFTKQYRKYLRQHTAVAEKELATLVSKSWPQPEVVVVLCTHFGLAHQLSAAKERLIRKLGVKLVVAVVVTDDSPQELWAVCGADIIFVPSNTTREILVERLMKLGGPMPELVTVPYPISLDLGKELEESDYQERINQAKGNELGMIVPISGAAVQLDFFEDMIGSVTADGVKVTVVCRETGYSMKFLDWCRQQSGVKVVSAKQDLEVVQAYDQEYGLQVIGVEVTKPSEQAFKVLFTPKQRGGALMLFSEPVGRQEDDNLTYLRRHKLIPSLDDQARIDTWCKTGNRVTLGNGILDRARHWRGVMLPTEGMWAGIALQRLISGGILEAMARFEGYIEGHEEIRSDGVRAVWHQLQKLV